MTPDPIRWFVRFIVQGEGKRGWYSLKYEDPEIDSLGLRGDQDPQDIADRIGATLNACEGIPLAALEEGVVQALISALQALTDPEGHIWHAGALLLDDECTGECKDVRAALAKVEGKQP